MPQVFLALISTDWLKTTWNEGAIPEDRMERTMLAVTGVNQCPLCSQAHSRMALEKGMDSGEIHNLLQGEDAEVPDKDLKAVLFAGHYADTGGAISKEVLQTLTAEYGDTGSAGKLGAVRIKRFGNSMVTASGTAERDPGRKEFSTTGPSAGAGCSGHCSCCSYPYAVFPVFRNNTTANYPQRGILK